MIFNKILHGINDITVSVNSNTLIDTFHAIEVVGHHISLQHCFRQHKSYSNLHNDAIDFFVPKIIISI